MYRLIPMDIITKTQAKLALHIDTDVAFGNWFTDKPSKQAVSQWGKDDDLPLARKWELIARRPDIFGTAPSNKESAA